MNGMHSQKIFLKDKVHLNLLNEDELVHKDMVVVPLLVNTNHWTVVLINNLTSTLYYKNPTGTTEKDVKNMLKMWQDYCKSQPIYCSKNWTYDVLKNTKQTDAISCGPFYHRFYAKVHWLCLRIHF